MLRAARAALRFLSPPINLNLVDALEPAEVWVLEKGPDGCSTIRRASDDVVVKNMAAEGLPLGGLWYSDYLDAR